MKEKAKQTWACNSNAIHCNYIYVVPLIAPHYPVEGDIVVQDEVPGTEYMFSCKIKITNGKTKRTSRNGDMVAIVRYDVVLTAEEDEYFRVDVFERQNDTLKKYGEYWIRNDEELELLENQVMMYYMLLEAKPIEVKNRAKKYK